jgi:predicted TIM-barrel fold metal-dependent hydrolase
MNAPAKRRVIDAHLHLYDHKQNRHDFLDHVDPMFQALVGDYSALPRRYLLENYLAEEPDLEIAGLVWNEFLSSDPVREVLWAQRMADSLEVPMSIVGLVDFLSPDLEARLDAFTQCANITAVREHLGWDDGNPLRRFAKRPDLLTDRHWLDDLKQLARYGLKCTLEIFSPQLPDVLTAVRLNPSIGFAIAVMGWPIATDKQEFTCWRQSLADLSACGNTRIVISAIECIFGMAWSIEKVQPWFQAVLELFGPERTMFGSHHPLCGLSSTHPTPYPAYETLAAGLSSAEQDAVFCTNAAAWFFNGLPLSGTSNFRRL